MPTKCKIQKKKKNQLEMKLKSNLRIFIFMVMNFAKNWHTSRMKLKCMISCQQLDHFHATAHSPKVAIGTMKIFTLNYWLKL
jgi:hypothetical protein